MYKYSRTSWEPEVIVDCECVFHRYNTVYICGCGKLVSHSQNDWELHKTHPNGINITSEYYYHGDTSITLWDRLQVYGLLPYDNPNFSQVSDALSSIRDLIKSVFH